jgi:uncharacterized coiled-coil protein SlyX
MTLLLALLVLSVGCAAWFHCRSLESAIAAQAKALAHLSAALEAERDLREHEQGKLEQHLAGLQTCVMLVADDQQKLSRSVAQTRTVGLFGKGLS